MRLEAHAKAPGDRAIPDAQGARAPVGLPPFFAGMTQTARSALQDALGESGGLILVAGPQGSGLSSTLRGLLRARPDALAIGEMGCHERAALALRSARGRLVLATATCGDSLGALRHLESLGIDPFSIACVLRLVLGQRQVRRLCPACRAPFQAPNSVTAPLGLDLGAVVYRSQGCRPCEGTGFAGLVGVFETMPVDGIVGRLIISGADDAAIANHVFRKWPNLATAVRALIVEGFATPEAGIELLRPRRH